MDVERIRILLVEDHQITRLGLAFLLSDISDLHVVGEAENGEQAVLKTTELRPDIVVMDVSMPVMDGIEATKSIKESNSETRILMLTSSERQDAVFACLAAGADGYVTKDTPNEHLIMAIRAVRSGAAWLDPTIARTVLMGSGKKAASPAPKASNIAEKKNEFGLSAREREILELLVFGMSNQQMAGKLFVSPETIKTHMKHIMEKLAVSDRTQAAVKAMRHGLTG